MANKVKRAVNVEINRAKLDRLMLKKRWKPNDLILQMKEIYGIDLKYKSLMALLSNKVTWKLLYAVVICQLLDTEINYLFDIVNNNDDKNKQ
jgi:DNA-binding Xre family transcriptional regulator